MTKFLNYEVCYLNSKEFPWIKIFGELLFVYWFINRKGGQLLFSISVFPSDPIQEVAFVCTSVHLQKKVHLANISCLQILLILWVFLCRLLKIYFTESQSKQPNCYTLKTKK